MLRNSSLAGVSLLALAIATTAAHAGAPTIVYGGGGTSSAKVYRDVFNCYSTLANGLYATTPGNPTTTAYPTGPSAGCTTQGTINVIIPYDSVGSTPGLTAFTEASPVGLGSPSGTNTIAYLDSTFGITETPYPEIQFATADVYLNGTTVAQAESTAGEPVFQLPAIVEPTTLSIGGIQNVKLKTADVCNLFSGSTNKVEGVTFSELVVRSDGAGSSYIFSDWLQKNCPAKLNFNAANGFPSTKPNWTAVVDSNANHIAVMAESGAAGVASTIVETANSIGYVTPDYVYPIVGSSTAYPAYVNGYLPNVAGSQGRVQDITYPTSYNVTTIGQQINDQLVAPGGKGYPILGYSFFDVYQCYSKSFGGGLIGGPAQGAALQKILLQFFPADLRTKAIINGQGFVSAPTALVTLLKSTGGPLNATGGIQNSSCPKT